MSGFSKLATNALNIIENKELSKEELINFFNNINENSDIDDVEREALVSAVEKKMRIKFPNAAKKVLGSKSKKAQDLLTEIFNEYGEDRFREAESSLLFETNNLENYVISTGGGIVISDTNRKFLRDHRVYYLNNSVETLYERAAKKRKQRPLMKNLTLNEFNLMYENRVKLYQECANITLNAENKTISEIVEEISNHEKFSF